MPSALRKVEFLWTTKVLEMSMTKGLSQGFFCQFEIWTIKKDSQSARNGAHVESDAVSSIK